MDFKEINGSAVTLTHSNGKIEIFVHPYFREWSSHRQELTVFHELGHALLGLGHDNLRYSVMNRSSLAVLPQYVTNRELMLDNLFK